jgi:type IV pilus assembly protein PilE
MNHTALRSRRIGGFTLIEMLIAVSVASVLSSIAYPSFQGVLHKARRSDALVALMQVQAAQERWRANHRSYATLAEIGVPASSSAGHYTLQVLSADDDAYEVVAVATGGQAHDAACRHLKLRLESATVTHLSGPDALVSNPRAANRRCWSL